MKIDLISQGNRVFFLTVKDECASSGKPSEVHLPISDEMYQKMRLYLPIERVSSGPIPMLLWCPSCHARHVDKGEWTTKSHHTHACQKCGLPWRPAIVPTVGVQFLPGFKDELALTREEEARGGAYQK